MQAAFLMRGPSGKQGFYVVLMLIRIYSCSAVTSKSFQRPAASSCAALFAASAVVQGYTQRTSSSPPPGATHSLVQVRLCRGTFCLSFAHPLRLAGLSWAELSWVEHNQTP